MIVQRRIGSGDREHVRLGLLNVGFFCGRDVTEQVEGAIRAATELKMMLRAHVGEECVMSVGLHNLMHRHTTHQLEVWPQLPRVAFESIFNKLDLLVTTTADRDVTQAEILRVWREHGGRFLEGNHAHRTDAELALLYPDMYPDPTPFWKAWSS